MEDMHAWILVGLGGIGVLGALGLSFKTGTGVPKVLLAWIFAVALLGLGTFGQGFLTDYKGFLGALADLLDEPSPSKSSQEKLLGIIANEKLDAEQKKLGLWALAQRPTKATLPLLAQYAASAEDPEGKALIEQQQVALEKDITRAKDLAAELQAAHLLERQHVKLLDKRFRRLIQLVPRHELTIHRIDGAVLENLRVRKSP